MTEAEAAIADLDEALEEFGQEVRLQRMALAGGVQTVSAEVTCRAMVRAYQPQELIAGSGIIQGDSQVILSPSEIAAATWPGVGLDPLPRRNDRVVIAGRSRNIETAAPLDVGGTVVRIEMQVRG